MENEKCLSKKEIDIINSYQENMFTEWEKLKAKNDSFFSKYGRCVSEVKIDTLGGVKGFLLTFYGEEIRKQALYNEC